MNKVPKGTPNKHRPELCHVRSGKGRARACRAFWIRGNGNSIGVFVYR